MGRSRSGPVGPFLPFGHPAHLVLNFAEHLSAQPEELNAVAVLRFGVLPAPHHHTGHRTGAVADKIRIGEREGLALLIALGALDTCPALADINNEAVLQVDRRRVLAEIAYPYMLVCGDSGMLSALFHWPTPLSFCYYTCPTGGMSTGEPFLW